MKSVKKLVTLFFIISLLGVGILFLSSFVKSKFDSTVPQTSSMITRVSGASVYKLYIDGYQYILVVSDNNSVTITKHR